MKKILFVISIILSLMIMGTIFSALVFGQVPPVFTKQQGGTGTSSYSAGILVATSSGNRGYFEASSSASFPSFNATNTATTTFLRVIENAGIGTGTPQATLGVQGTAIISSTTTVAGFLSTSSAFNVRADGVVGIGMIQGDYPLSIAQGDDTGSASVGFYSGTTSPPTVKTVFVGSLGTAGNYASGAALGDTVLRSQQSLFIVANPQGLTDMVVRRNDNEPRIGVGTTTPGQMFSVHGNTLIVGTTTVRDLLATSTLQVGSAGNVVNIDADGTITLQGNAVYKVANDGAAFQSKGFPSAKLLFDVFTFGCAGFAFVDTAGNISSCTRGTGNTTNFIAVDPTGYTYTYNFSVGSTTLAQTHKFSVHGESYLSATTTVANFVATGGVRLRNTTGCNGTSVLGTDANGFVFCDTDEGVGGSGTGGAITVWEDVTVLGAYKTDMNFDKNTRFIGMGTATPITYFSSGKESHFGASSTHYGLQTVSSIALGQPNNQGITISLATTTSAEKRGVKIDIGGFATTTIATGTSFSFATSTNETATPILSVSAFQGRRRVGIGTSSPMSGFTVANYLSGADTFENGILLYDANGLAGEHAIRWQNAGAGRNFFYQGLDQANRLDVGYGTGMSGANTLMSLTNGRLVGIGTGTPTLGRLAVLASDNIAVPNSIFATGTSTFGIVRATSSVKTEQLELRGILTHAKNASLGTCTLVSGACVVTNNRVTATSTIFVTAQNVGGTPGDVRVSARTSGTSFTISSYEAGVVQTLDTSIIGWMIIEPFDN